MLSPEEINDLAYAIADRFEAVNTFYIEKMAEQIKEIGQLSADNVNKLVEMSKMSQNIDEINKMLARQTGLALKDLYKIYEISGMREYADASIFFEGKGIEQIAFKENVDIQNYINAMSRTTANTFVNLANTTSVQQTYKDVIDTAVQAASSGVTDYNSMIKSVLQNAAVQGMRVEYKSGATRRLDSAARMNILDGVRELNNGLRQIQGEQFGADGVEIDAHSLCAKDHLPYQGKQYSIEAFNKIQSNLKRKISTCNCKHGISYIVLGISPPTYSQKELEEMKYNSTEKISVNGHQMTRYEATQYMRRIETAMRYKKDEIIAFDTAGMDTKKSKQDLRNLQASYRQIGKDAGLRLRYDRAYVPGYRGKQVEPKQIKISAKDTIKPKNINDELINKIKLKSIWEGCPEDKKELIINAAKNADPKMLKLALDNMDNCSVIWKGEEDGGGCFHLDGTITMEGKDSYDPMTFWHEYGHFLDKYSGKGYTYHYPNGSTYFVPNVTTIVDETGYKKAAYKDISKMLDKLGLSDKYGVIEGTEYTNTQIISKLTGDPIDTMHDYEASRELNRSLKKYFDDKSGKTRAENYLYEMGYPKSPEYEDYYEYYRTPKRQTLKTRPKFKGAEDAYTEAKNKYYDVRDEFTKTHNMDELLAEQDRLTKIASAKQNALGFVSDTFDGEANGAFASTISLGGHTPEYYLTSSGNIREGVANVYSQSIVMDKDVEDLFNDVCPNVYKLIKEGWNYEDKQ